MVPAATGQAVALRGLTKVYDGHVVVDHIDLDVPTGSFFGLVGPNGAGKTTTLSMVTGLLRPDGGRVMVAGVDVWADPVSAKARMGVLPDGLRLFERLSGTRAARLPGPAARECRPDWWTHRAKELIDVLDLDEAGNKLVADYSTGMRKKITLAAALLHSPPVLLLDEPLEAVDPVSARIIRGVLARYTGGGGTVVFSSHVMALVEGLCSHVAVMDHGRIVAAGDLRRCAAPRPASTTRSCTWSAPTMSRREGWSGWGLRPPEMAAGHQPGPDRVERDAEVGDRRRDRRRRAGGRLRDRSGWPPCATTRRSPSRWSPGCSPLQLVAWMLAPLVAFGVDETVDPTRFALLPIRPPVLQRGLLVASLVGYLPMPNAIVLLGGAIGIGRPLGTAAGGAGLRRGPVGDVRGVQQGGVHLDVVADVPPARAGPGHGGRVRGGCRLLRAVDRAELAGVERRRSDREPERWPGPRLGADRGVGRIGSFAGRRLVAAARWSRWRPWRWCSASAGGGGASRCAPA